MADISTDYASGLVAAWEFNGDATDATTNFDLTAVGVPTYTSDGSGIQGNEKAILSGSTQYFKITGATYNGTALDLDGTTDFSLAMWYSLDAGAANNQLQGVPRIFSVHGVSNRMCLIAHEYNSGSERFRVSMAPTTTSYTTKYFSMATSPSAGVLQHFVMRYDKSAGSIQCFQNGTSLGTQTGYPTSINDASNGDYEVGAQTTNGITMDGHVAQFLHYNTYISDSYVSGLYNSGDGVLYSGGGGGPTVYNALAMSNF